MSDRHARTVAANQAVHTALATSGEYDQSPHFRPENKAKVRGAIEALLPELPGPPKCLLDIGCGTGFIIDLVADLFPQIHGVDVTPAMLAGVHGRHANVSLHLALAEHTPFADATFDLVTAYSFLDHLDDHAAVFAEAYRVLKPGGLFYADLNPNKHFTDALAHLSAAERRAAPEIVAREIQGMLHNGEYYESRYGIDAATLDAAEPVKSGAGGFDAELTAAQAAAAGFSDTRYRYDWYLGQAVMMHQRSAGTSDTIETYLREALPATRHLFKYVRFVFRK